MNDWLAAQTASNAEKTFFLFEGQAHSYAEVNGKAGRWAAKLKDLGITQNDVIAVLLTNSPDYIYICFALMRLGVTFLPLNTRLKAKELEYQLKKTRAKLLLTSADFLTAMPELQTSLPCQLIEDGVEETLEPLLSSKVDLERRFCIMFTSGTTGKPKGACLSLNNFFYSANASAYRLGLQTHDNWLCAMPLYHVGGLSIVLRSCLYGTSFTLHSRFEFDKVMRVLSDERQGITLASLVPTMLYRLLQDESFKASARLRLILLGGAAANAKLLEDAKARDLNVLTTYGLTEACSQVATLSVESSFAEGKSSAGKALMFTDIKIVNDDSSSLAVGEVGEILVRSPTVMQGYFEDDAATQKALQGGWLHTGDLGCLDAEGYLFIEARRSDLIVSGGENIYPNEVEDVLREHPSVTNVAVVGLADLEWGEKVIAAVQLASYSRDAKDDMVVALEDLCSVNLAAYKRPKQYVFVADLPQTASGKVKRSEVKQRLVRRPFCFDGFTKQNAT